MAFVIFGSSNVYRNFNTAVQQGVTPGYSRAYEVVNCTKETVFTSSLATRPGISLLVASVLSNFLSDAGSSSAQTDRLDALNQVISGHITLLSKYAQSNPTTRIVIVPPLPRTVPDWFNAYLPGLSSLLLREVLALATSQIVCLSPFIAPTEYFESDGVHLNSVAGVEFIKYIFAGVDQAYPVVDCPVTQMPRPPQPQGDLTMLATAVRDLTSFTQSFHEDALTRREQDNLVFARLKEDRDFELNKSRENRFTVSGLCLRRDQIPPRDLVQRKDFFRGILQDLVNEACPDVEPKPEVQDVYVNMRNGSGSPFIEGRMESVASSSAFRIAGAKLAKAESGNFKGLFIANAVTLATRVRIEILRALALLLTVGSQEAFVKGFSLRPVMCVKAKAPVPEVSADVDLTPVRNSDPGRNYTFCEAVEKWGHRLSQVNLTKAYRKARPAFTGCLEQYFVVLRETFDEDDATGIFGLLSESNAQPLGAGFHGRGTRPFSRPGSSRGSRGFRGRPAFKRTITESEEQPFDSPSKYRK